MLGVIRRILVHGDFGNHLKSLDKSVKLLEVVYWLEIFREANGLVDSLAKAGIGRNQIIYFLLVI